MKVNLSLLAPLLVGAVALSACRNTAAGARQDMNEAASKATGTANDAGKAVKDAATQAGGVVAAAVETIDVKTALIADRTVDASAIDVDTFHETKTVVLKGSVPTAAQKEEAERIAAAEAPGYKIDNRLQVV